MATLYPIDKFWFHLADGRVLPVEQYDRVVYIGAYGFLDERDGKV